MSKRKAKVPAKRGSKAKSIPPAGRKPVDPPTANPQPTLKPEHLEFCLAYVSNGFNATQAYLAVYPNSGYPAARTGGYRLLTNADIKTHLLTLLEDRWKPFHMTGDEVLARVAKDARADVRLLVNEKGERLGLHELPDDIAESVEAVEFDEDGKVRKIKLASKTAARRTILEVTGKVKQTGGVDELAQALTETLEKNAKRFATAR